MIARLLARADHLDRDGNYWHMVGQAGRAQDAWAQAAWLRAVVETERMTA